MDLAFILGCARSGTSILGDAVAAHLYGLPPPLLQADLPVASYRYWIRANRQAIERGRRLQDRFLLIGFEDMCAAPRQAIAKLMEFLGLPEAPTLIGDLAKLVKHRRPSDAIASMIFPHLLPMTSSPSSS